MPAPPLLPLRSVLTVWAACWWLGLAYLFVDPPYQSPDEPNHFLRAWTVASGDFVAQIGGVDGHSPGGWVPNSFAETEALVSGAVRGHPGQPQDRRALANAWQMAPQPALQHFARLPNTGGYSPLSYAGAALALRLARGFELAPIAYLYVARLGNLFAWSLLITAAIALVPYARWTLLLLACTPMALFQAASASADGWNHGLALLTVAWLLRMAASTGAVTVRAWTLTCGLLLLVGLTRQTLVPLALLAWLVPRHRFAGRGSWLLFGLTCGLAAALPALAWTKLTHLHLVPLRAEAIPAHQLEFAAAHPGLVLQKILATLPHGRHWLTEFIGTLGWLDTALPPALVTAYWLALAGSLLLASERCAPGPDWCARLLSPAVGALCLLLIMYGLFVVWTPRENALIEGMQGRYLTPLAPLLAVALAWPFARLRAAWLGPLVLAGAALLNAFALRTLLARYWS